MDDKQSSKSKALSATKRRLDMKDGDEHFNVGVTSVAPINDAYLAIKALSLFPSVLKFEGLVVDTKSNK